MPCRTVERNAGLCVCSPTDPGFSYTKKCGNGYLQTDLERLESGQDSVRLYLVSGKEKADNYSK
jgi:hypothetical protein